MNEEKNIQIFKEKLETGFLSESGFNNLINIHYPNNKNVKFDRLTEVKDSKKISVIIPTYNRLEQVSLCINSILSQSYSNIEIILIDDCSTDETNSKFSNYPDKRVKYILNEVNLGMGLNRQKGYKASTGDYIIFCDDDDYFIDHTYFENIIRIFEDNDINVICTNSFVHYEKEDIFELNKLNFDGKISSIEYLKNFQFNYLKPNSTFCAVFRKTCLEEANFKDMKMMNDTSIYLRALMMGKYSYVYEKVIGVYRVHGQNYTFNVKADFIIKNLIEKKFVYEYVIKNNLFDNTLSWYEKEVAITVNYFLSGKKENNKETKKVLSWVKENVSFKLYLKFYLKNLLKWRTN